MKRKLQFTLSVLFLAFAIVSCNNDANTDQLTQTAELKETLKKHLENSPFKEQLKLSKEERKALGLPPNKYNEEQWELTMNPALGRPTPHKVAILQKQLLEQRKNDLLAGRVPGDAVDNGWVERGPNNVGGRTRAIMFDPNDSSNETVFAGGVSGGLWKNTNISNANSQWTQVGIPENFAVSTITYDPLNTNVFYVGTGESYVGHTDGAANGDGIWKSEDGGDTWTNVFGGSTGDSFFVSESVITVNTPSGVAGNYVSYPTTAFGTEITSTITADFVLANDTTGGEPTEGCNVFGADATGKIAVIRRGNCNFDDKVKFAQNAGAIGVIMMNNIPGDPIPMGGDDTTITIPSVMISKADGDLIEAAMASGTVNGSLNPASGDFTAVVVPGIRHINDIAVKERLGFSDVYVAAGHAIYGSSNAATIVGGLDYGVYKYNGQTDSWSELTLPLTSTGLKHNPNDIEIGADGTIWVATTQNYIDNSGGGKIFKSTDNGATFTEAYAIPGAYRTQIAVSATNQFKIYALAWLAAGGTTIRLTTTGFTGSTVTLPLPNDPYFPSDFTNGQAFYNLALDVDPLNDNIVFAGGISIFKSTNAGSSWTKTSYAYSSNGSSYVHADQHKAVFGNGDSSKMVFANDGGVYYTNNGGITISARNNGYNTAQFYTVGVAPTSAFTGEYFAGGLQDNGTQSFENANPNGTDSTIERYGGDGAYTFFDQDGTDQYFIRNYVYNNGVNLYNFSGSNVTLNSEGSDNGSFINPQALDSNLDILYSNYSSSGNYVVRRYSRITSASTLTKTDLTSPLLTTTPTAFTVSPYQTFASTLLLGTVLGDVLLVQNAHRATPIWTALDGNSLVGSVSDIEFGQNENEIFVTMHNYGVNNIWYTSDQGANWEAKDGDLPDLPVKAILQNPLNLEEVIIGTELGVWYTNNFSDANPTWRQAYNGMSNVKVLDLDLRDDNVVFAATHGRGVFSGSFAAGTLSVEENQITDSITLFPTVSDGNITIKSKNSLNDINLTIYNLSGQEVYNIDLNLSSTNRELKLNLSSGIYLARFNNNSITETKKIIIK